MESKKPQLGADPQDFVVAKEVIMVVNDGMFSLLWKDFGST